ncbi:MAG TPA: septum formation initiator family protein [Rhizomicrobium sp.]|nr:septum formation initiator family protein [Rhizomicrobium sp.]
MRIKRSVTRFFGASLLPAICTAVIVYFGYYAISGTRGYTAYHTVSAELAAQQQKLASVRGDRMRLEHRIDLLDQADPDMVLEVEHNQMTGSAPGEMAMPRDGH